MTWSFVDWSPDDQPGEIVNVTSLGAWGQLEDYYTSGAGNAPLNRIFTIAKAHGVKSVVIERRYIDLDWRSEHAHFYGHNFQRYPSVCHRLHFFADHVPGDLNLDGLEDSYRGYSVMRPLPLTPVGRTMIAPPSDLDHGVRCEAEDRIDLFGWPLKIRAMPFVSQDADYLRCSHAALWMVLYHAHLRHGQKRHLPADIHDASMGGVIVGRQVPSEGLSVHQMLAAGTALGLSPGMPYISKSEHEDRAASALGLRGVVSRYVNSQLPPIITSSTHVWVISGYRRVVSGDRNRIELWRHDDARGPYLAVADPWNESEEAHRQWRTMITPLLPKVYVSAELAEAAARAWFSLYMKSEFLDAEVADLIGRGLLASRTYVIRSREYKESLKARGMDAGLINLYRFAHWPRYVWVVEAVDRSKRDEGVPDVVGEAIFDATTATHHSKLESGVLSLHISDFVLRTSPDHGDDRRVVLEASGYYRTGRPVAVP